MGSFRQAAFIDYSIDCLLQLYASNSAFVNQSLDPKYSLTNCAAKTPDCDAPWNDRTSWSRRDNRTIHDRSCTSFRSVNRGRLCVGPRELGSRQPSRTTDTSKKTKTKKFQSLKIKKQSCYSFKWHLCDLNLK